MGKKKTTTDRQAVIDQLRRQQKSAERRRGFAIVGVSVTIALLIVGAAAYQPIKNWWDGREFDKLALAEIGEAPAVCQEPITKKAEGQQDHVPEGTPLVFTDAPPAFGQHFDRSDSMERKLYTAADRPELGNLVHNLEHGYTLMWYDETAAEDDEMMADIRAIADKFGGTDNFRMKFKAVPWTEEDGEAFPEGQHVALTHWSKGGVDAGAEGKQVGVWQYCSAPSGEALEEFMNDYPYLDSPEPNAM